jgi:hypothetical protein
MRCNVQITAQKLVQNLKYKLLINSFKIDGNYIYKNKHNK